MKGKRFLAVTGVILFALFSSAVTAADLSVNKTGTPIVIDGTAADAVWGLVEENMVANQFVGVVDGPADSEGSFKMLWDDNFLYFFCTVTDEILLEDSEGANEHDESFDLFFDTAPVGGSVSSPSDDYLLTLEWASSGTCLKSGFKNSDLFATVDTTDIVAKCTETPDGYSIEAAIPLEALTLSAGDVFGFDLRINDDDDGGSRDTQIAWFCVDPMGWGTGWNMPSMIAELELVNETVSVTSNFDFEQPGTEKIKGWDGACSDVSYTGSNADIPGWSSDTPAFDSGVEQNGGSWVAFLMAFDPSMVQLTNVEIQAGDYVTVAVDARNSWSESGEQRFKMSLYYDNAGARETIVSREIVLPDAMARYDLGFNAADYPAAVGKKLGIEFDNINATARSWYYLDNVELFTNVMDNADFEMPGTEKIKGWDGACSDVSYTGSNAEIPGWSSDTPAFDSGVEQNGGSWVAFLMAFDPSMFQVTRHTVGANDVVTLSVDARNSWSESGVQNFVMSLYADNGGTRETIVSREIVLPDAMARYDLSFNAADYPAAVGKKLGIELDNTNATPRSWYYLDNVQLALSGTTAVAEEKRLSPEEFSLSQNYPNPFNPTTTIHYALRKNGKVRLAVYDLTGREVAVLVDGVRRQGNHQVTFSGEGLSNGVFFYKLRTEDTVITKKMILLK
jgi:hypothetical protein